MTYCDLKIQKRKMCVFCVVMGVLKGDRTCAEVRCRREDSFGASSFMYATIESKLFQAIVACVFMLCTSLI